MNNEACNRRSWLRFLQLLLLFWLAALLLFARRETAQLHTDRAVYASIALTMAESGDWLQPRLGGEPYYKKPPLVFWLAALAAKLFGRGPVALSLPSTLSALGLTFAVYFLARRWLGHPGGLAAAFILITSPFFIRNACLLRLDAPQTLAITAAILAVESGRGRPSAPLPSVLPLAGLFMGLGCLAKGPVALLPAGIYFLLALLRREAFPFNRWSFWAGIPLFFAAVLPWYLYMIAARGREFIDVHFGLEQVGRVGVPRSGTEVQNFLEGSFIDLLRYHWPWLPFLLVGFVLGAVTAVRRKGGESGGGEAKRAAQISLVWTGLHLATLFFVRSSFQRYLIPAYPAMAVLTALPVQRWLLPWIAARARAWAPRWSDPFALEAAGTGAAALALAAAATVFSILPFSFTWERYPEIDLIKSWHQASPEIPVLALPECKRYVAIPMLHANAGMQVPIASAEEIASLAGSGGPVAVVARAEQELPEALRSRKPILLVRGWRFSLYFLEQPRSSKPAAE